MPVKQITKTMYECTCARPECLYHTKPWIADNPPLRCPSCKSRRWNRPARLSAKAPLTFNGKTQTVAAWSRELGLAKTTIPWRIKNGFPLEQVLSKEDWRKQ